MIHLIADEREDSDLRPYGNAHADKVTHSERREQMQQYYAMNRERIAAARRKKYQENRGQLMLDTIELEAARIARIVNDEGARLVIIVKGKPSLHRPDSAAAKKHYAHCKRIVGTYDFGSTRELISEDLREAMK